MHLKPKYWGRGKLILPQVMYEVNAIVMTIPTSFYVI